jgi:hypothetical protein
VARKSNPARDLAALQSDARAVAEKLEGLHHRFRLHRLGSRVTEHRARAGERTPLADLGEAARTLRCYAGFLELVISAVKRQSEAPTLPTVIQ